jgi:hypothetical protein
VLAICSQALDQESMGPATPFLLLIQMTFSAANRFINQGYTTREPDPASLRIAFEEFLVA